MKQKATDQNSTTTQILRIFGKVYLSALAELMGLLTKYKTSERPPLKYKMRATLFTFSGVLFVSSQVVVNLFRVLWKKYTKRSGPPPLTEFLLAMVLDRKERVYLLGDLERDYRKNLAKKGWLYAKGLYYRDALSYAKPKLINWWYWVLKKLSKIGVLAWIAEYIRRKIS